MTDAGHSEDTVLDKDKHAGIRRISVSDETFVFHTVEVPGHKVTGAEIVHAAGKHPADDYAILLHLPNGEMEMLRPDEVVDLGRKAIERFFVIKSGVSYRFVVDGQSLEWALKSILGKHVKFLVNAGDDKELVQEHENAPATIIGDDELVYLDAPGVERLKTRPAPHKVKVIYNHKPFEIDRGVYTTEELLAVFSVPAGYKLDLVRPDGEFRELQPGEKIRVHEGMEFASHPPCGKSS